MAAATPRDLPTVPLECFDHLDRPQQGERGALNGYFDFTSLVGQRKSLLLAHCEAFPNRILNVLFSLFFGFALADTTRNRGAFRDKYSVFILPNGNQKLHRNGTTTLGYTSHALVGQTILSDQRPQAGLPVSGVCTFGGFVLDRVAAAMSGAGSLQRPSGRFPAFGGY